MSNKPTRLGRNNRPSSLLTGPHSVFSYTNHIVQSAVGHVLYSTYQNLLYKLTVVTCRLHNDDCSWDQTLSFVIRSIRTKVHAYYYSLHTRISYCYGPLSPITMTVDKSKLWPLLSVAYVPRSKHVTIANIPEFLIVVNDNRPQRLLVIGPSSDLCYA